MQTVLDYLRDHILLLDGGMGTLLQAAGLPAGTAPETWNLTHPDIVRSVHAACYAAGSHVVSTNTFGANLLHFDEEILPFIIRQSVRLAREAASAAPGRPSCTPSSSSS